MIKQSFEVNSNMSTNAKGFPDIQDMDTNQMFRLHTVEEIRGIEKRTRADIERKKEDLRTMVGERYRELIEAADTIAEMKNSAQNVMSTIGRIEFLCMDLKQASMIKGSSLQQRKEHNMEIKKKEEAHFHEVSSQIKLLLDIPERVWTYLDGKDYLSASRLYLLAQHVHTSLQLTSHKTNNLLRWFPVLNRQWAAISHFRTTILQGCRQLIRETAVSDQKIAECLVSILLLENSNPRQVFTEILLARTSAVEQLFQGSSETGSIKDMVCMVVQIIMRTIHQIHAVFYQTSSDMSGNLLLKILTSVTTERQCESGLLDLQSSVSARCLPNSVIEFCPSHKSISLGISESHLRDSCMQWIQTCSSNVQAGVSKMLSYVNNVKHLATIRDTVWTMMTEDECLEDWDTVCGEVLNSSLHIWDGLIRPLFLERVKALIRYQLECSVELTERQISKVMTEMDTAHISVVQSEVDLGSYVWSEGMGDISPNTAWAPTGSKCQADIGGLTMKAKAYTPVVQSFCKNFDEKLYSVSEDFKFYIYTDVDILTVTMETKPFNRFADSASLLGFVQTMCVESVNNILTFLTNILEECKQTLTPADHRQTRTGNKLLLAGRLSGALSDLTPHLQQCIMGKDLIHMADGTRSMMKKSGSCRLIGPHTDTNTVFENVNRRLHDFQYTAYRVWLDHIVQISMSAFTTAVKSQTPEDLIRTCAKWDEVSIEEETEEGNKITSKISVPVQASWYVMSMLYGLCCDLNHVGGHALARSVLEHLVRTVADGMVGVYFDLVKQSKDKTTWQPVNQQRALQMLFDVKFLKIVLPRRDDSKEMKQYEENIEMIVSSLEEFVDPFDLDVFSPYMQANLNKLLQRTAVVLGSLTCVDRTGLYGLMNRPVSGGGGQEHHNVLLLSLCQSRFSLLPLTYPANQLSYATVTTPQPVITHTLYRDAESSGPSLSKLAVVEKATNQQPGKLATSSSFYDRLGTGLGSMSELSSWFTTIGSK